MISVSFATAPNPGHNFSEISGGIAQGDILYGSAADTLSALAKNTSATRYLSNTGSSNNPAWAQIDLSNGVTGTLPSANGGTANAFFTVSGPATSAKTFTFPNASATVLTDNAAVTATQGGTGQTSYTTGDILYASDSSTLSKLASVAAGSYLRSAGTSAAPVWSTVTLPNSATQGDVWYSSASNAISALAAGSSGQFLKTQGAGANPAWDLPLGYTINVQALTSSPADATTVYFGTLPKAPVTAAATSKVYIRKAGTIKIAEIYVYSGTAGTNENWSLYIRKNNTTDTLIATVAAATNERVFSNTGLSISVAAGDYIEIKGVQPTWTTNPATTIYGGYIYIE